MFWDPDGLYPRSIHGYFTYLTALSAGIPEERAREIAFFAWGPDATESLNAIGAIKLNLFHPKTEGLHSVPSVQNLHVIYSEKMPIGPLRTRAANALRTLDLPELNQLLTWRKGISSNGGYGGYIYQAKLSDDQIFGLISHYFQDSYSHTDSKMVDDPKPTYDRAILEPPSGVYHVSGLKDLKPNKIIQKPYYTFTSPFGHMNLDMNQFTNHRHHELGAEEDDPFLKPRVFRSMASHYYDIMIQYSEERHGLMPRVSKSKFLEYIEQILGTPGSSASDRDMKRHRTIQDIIQNMGDRTLENTELNFLPEDGEFRNLIELLKHAPSGRKVQIDSKYHQGFFYP